MINLSIPLWSDFIATPCREDGADLKILSIPLWSDFILTYDDLINLTNFSPFNPTMVWFYLLLRIYCEFTDTMFFQSHYGLILSVGHESTAKLLSKLLNAFNPTMVWFYHIWLVTSCLDITAFQSHYGLILSKMQRQKNSTNSTTFNPTMVWFYPDRVTP